VGDDVATEVAEGETGDASKRGEEEAFGQYLAEDAGAAGSEGEANGHLALAGCGAREQKVGEVGAREQKNEARENGEDIDRRGIVMGGCCKTLAAGFDDEVGHARVLWHGDGSADVLFEPDGEGGTDGFVGDAGASASHDRHPPLIGVLEERGILRGHQGGLHAEGKEDVGRELDAGGSGEAGRVDANDGDGDEIKLDGFADD